MLRKVKTTDMPQLDSVLHILLCLMILLLLFAISYQDIGSRQISNQYVIALFVLGLASLTVEPEIGIADRLAACFVVSGPLLVLALNRPNSIGGGDIKLMAAAGFLLGLLRVCLAAAIGILLAAVYAVGLIVIRKASLEEHFAFGPALCVGIALAYCFGDTIIIWLM